MKRVTIKNFKGIKEVSFEPAKINAFIGKIGAGKTSILEAITFCITGKGDASMIRKGCTSCYVRIDFEDGEKIERRRDKRSSKVRINGEMSTQDVAARFIKSKGIDPDQFSSSKSGIWDHQIDTDNFSRFFFSILPLNLSISSLDKITEEFLGEKPLQKAMDYVHALFYGKTNLSFQDLEAAYKHAYQERADQRRLLSEMKARYLFEGDVPTSTKEDLEKRLSACTRIEIANQTYKNQLEEYTRNEKSRKLALEKKAEIEKRLDLLADVVKPDENVYKKCVEEREKFVDAIHKAREQSGTVRANNAVFERTLKSLEKPVCPISERLVCNTDKSPLKGELEALIQKNNKMLEDFKVFEDKCIEQIKKRDATKNEYHKAEAKYKEKESLERYLNSLVIPEKTEAPLAPPAYDPKEKAEIMTELNTVTRYLLFKQNEAGLQALQEKADYCDFAVTILNPKAGIYSLIIQKAILPLEDVCNKKATALKSGMRIQLNNEEGIEIMVSPKAGEDFLPINKVSAGEFVMATYLMMGTICSVTGTKIMLIDNADKLDGESFQALMKLIEKDENMQHVFIAAVEHEETEEIMKKYATIYHL